MRSPSDPAQPRLVLASASPRRAKLLADAGFAFEVIKPPLDDAALDPGRTRPRAWAASLAYLKGHAVRRILREHARHGDLVLAADTIVLKGAEMIGQPRDADDARRILCLLRDCEHTVLTGVAILIPFSERRDIIIDEAVVRVGPIPDGDLDAYIASEQWRGKAGAYNLEERLAAGWPITFDGDPGTIMGLPMRLLIPKLRTALDSLETAGAPA